MRDLRSVLTTDVRQEFLDRFHEIATEGGGDGGMEGFESLGLSVDDAVKAFEKVDESPGAAELPGDLEAIILRFGRPAFFVKNDTFSLEDTPSTAEEVDGEVTQAKKKIDAAIPRVGRINLRDHRMNWVGTGWVVAPNVVVTNRHVAREFAERDGQKFAFVESVLGRVAKADLDLCREHLVRTERVFRLPEVLWIEPSKAGYHDVAFLKMNQTGMEGEQQPAHIDLMSDAEFADVQPGRWLAVIGYPAFSPYNDAQDQQRIFQGVFDVKRMQPGKATSLTAEGAILHDASTLGGNSGSLVLDLATGKAMALHFGGNEGETNYAVTAPVVRKLLNERLGIG